MIKNYTKEGQKLPLMGVGPYIVGSMGVFTLISILLIVYVWQVESLPASWFKPCYVLGGILIFLGMLLWYLAAIKADIDTSIENNELKTTGIYGWVRNPLYSAFYLAFVGISLFYHNVGLVIVPIGNWLIMSISIILTEEKWLKELYGEKYVNYMHKVNRCIPCPPKQN